MTVRATEEIMFIYGNGALYCITLNKVMMTILVLFLRGIAIKLN